MRLTLDGLCKTRSLGMDDTKKYIPGGGGGISVYDGGARLSAYDTQSGGF